MGEYVSLMLKAEMHPERPGAVRGETALKCPSNESAWDIGERVRVWRVRSHVV